ncbi:DUF4124 domain-containing protein [Massilia cavernae]|uniref:DUF4124 domain-containing protein n=1 Tax=Massilia cavernae TaxID=2320864 RepID=A0A418Y4L8_9BURK|nr:DUF4124 domain-containing protein [Massilia cavernae]RJG20813.1 DUF4124 domain-containing protein [Massilia cavernae]
MIAGTPTFRRLLAGAALLAAAGMANAQYVWIDEKGIKQFSDRSPPSSIPDKNILKAPGRQPVALVPTDVDAQAKAAADAKTAAAAAKAAPLTVAERNMDFNKRAAEKAERDKKAAEEAKMKAAVAENCTVARDYMAQLDSGVRLATTSKGEPAYMSDAERALNKAKTAKVIASCK